MSSLLRSPPWCQVVSHAANLITPPNHSQLATHIVHCQVLDWSNQPNYPYYYVFWIFYGIFSSSLTYRLLSTDVCTYTAHSPPDICDTSWAFFLFIYAYCLPIPTLSPVWILFDNSQFLIVRQYSTIRILVIYLQISVFCGSVSVKCSPH